MRSSNPKDKLAQMHFQLDRELQMVNGGSTKQLPKPQVLPPRFKPEPVLPKAKPLTSKHEVQTILPTQSAIANKRNQISELQRKLMELQQKMSNIDLASEDSIDEQVEEVVRMSRRKIAQKVDLGPNYEDTARFAGTADYRDRSKKKYSQPLSDEQEEEEEDSQDYFQVQKAIEKKKDNSLVEQKKDRANIVSATRPTKIARQASIGTKERDTLRINQGSSKNHKRTVSQQEKYNINDKNRKISLQSQSLLKPKYANEASQRSKKSKNSIKKPSLSQSRQSKKSQYKPLVKSNSRQSLKSQKQSENNNSRYRSKEKGDSIYDEDQNFRQKLHSQQMQIVRQTKKLTNLEKQLMHYKRLSKKYEEQIQGYRVMEIEFKQLKKHFAKSEMIRGQQKKVIEALKSKMNK